MLHLHVALKSLNNSLNSTSCAAFDVPEIWNGEVLVSNCPCITDKRKRCHFRVPMSVCSQATSGWLRAWGFCTKVGCSTESFRPIRSSTIHTREFSGESLYPCMSCHLDNDHFVGQANVLLG